MAETPASEAWRWAITKMKTNGAIILAFAIGVCLGNIPQGVIMRRHIRDLEEWTDQQQDCLYDSDRRMAIYSLGALKHLEAGETDSAMYKIVEPISHFYNEYGPLMSPSSIVSRTDIHILELIAAEAQSNAILRSELKNGPT